MSRLAKPSAATVWRRVGAETVGIVGVAAYNWWVAVALQPGLLTSSNGFFSDLEASGQSDASLFQHLDLLAAILLLLALVLRGPRGRNGVRRVEWPWLLAFAVAGGVGARYPYACSEGTSLACQNLQWHFRLPASHYLHIASGIVEFATVTAAAVLARRRTLACSTAEAHVHRAVVAVFVVAYPLLGAAYLTDRLGAIIEPVFFLAFSAMILAELFEPGFVAPGGDLAEESSRRPSSTGVG
ncbi:MAG: DUF998 domain-containing protein [Acidimicrobiales bacterium]|jgi:hypothetical protein